MRSWALKSNPRRERPGLEDGAHRATRFWGRMEAEVFMCLGIPGKVVGFEEGPLRLGRVAFGDVVKEVSLAFVPEAGVGDYVVVHAGTAIEVIDEEAAMNVFETFRELDAHDEALAKGDA